jgi:hypothetical protein
MRKSKKNKQHNCQMKKDKRTNNDLQNNVKSGVKHHNPDP